MANYYGAARSNYIRWNPEKLQALEWIFPITSVTKEGTDLKAILFDYDGGTPDAFLDVDKEGLRFWLDEDHVSEDYDELHTLGLIPGREDLKKDLLLGKDLPEVPDHISLLDVVHLAFAEDPGGLFVWMYSGAEKLRYIDGGAIAIDASGEIVNQITLDDIYQTPGVNTHASC